MDMNNENEKKSSAEYVKLLMERDVSFKDVKDKIEISELSASELNDFVTFLRSEYEPDIRGLYVGDSYDEHFDFTKISLNDKNDKFFMLALTRGMDQEDVPQFVQQIGDEIKQDSATKVGMCILNNNVYDNLEFTDVEVTDVIAKEPRTFDNKDISFHKIDWESPSINWDDKYIVEGIVAKFGKEVIPQQVIQNDSVKSVIGEIGTNEAEVQVEHIDNNINDIVSEVGQPENDTLSFEQVERGRIAGEIKAKFKYSQFLKDELAIAQKDLEVLENGVKETGDDYDR